MDAADLYHEKQRLGHCAIHTLNNIYQESWVTYDMIADIAKELHRVDLWNKSSTSFFGINPYMSLFPYYGDFDITCIQRLLEQRGSKIVQHIITEDQMTSIRDIDAFAFVVNLSFFFRSSLVWHYSHR